MSKIYYNSGLLLKFNFDHFKYVGTNWNLTGILLDVYDNEIVKWNTKYKFLITLRKLYVKNLL